jgi:hypothetical protein
MFTKSRNSILCDPLRDAVSFQQDRGAHQRVLAA